MDGRYKQGIFLFSVNTRNIRSYSFIFQDLYYFRLCKYHFRIVIFKLWPRDKALSRLEMS